VYLNIVVIHYHLKLPDLHVCTSHFFTDRQEILVKRKQYVHILQMQPALLDSVIFAALHQALIELVDKKFFFCSLIKCREILIVFTLLSPNMTTKLPCCPPLLREEGLNSKNCICNKKKYVYYITTYIVK
jgi:hypothetical protein